MSTCADLMVSMAKVNKHANPAPSQQALCSQPCIHVVQNRRPGEQKSHWDKINKENYHFILCMSFVCLVPVRLLLSSVAVLYHVNGQLQRAYYFQNYELLNNKKSVSLWDKTFCGKILSSREADSDADEEAISIHTTLQVA